MKRNELIKLRELVNEEVKRRERIKDLLKNELVREYLEITNINPIDLDISDIKEIINQILSSFTIIKTNGIYVCTSAWYIGYHICYEETYYYDEYVEIDSEYAEYRTYTDIESNKAITAVKQEHNRYGRALIANFEANNTILNPYNTNKNQNGYNEVRMDFFETALIKGQTKAKKLILSKYPKL